MRAGITVDSSLCVEAVVGGRAKVPYGSFVGLVPPAAERGYEVALDEGGGGMEVRYPWSIWVMGRDVSAREVIDGEEDKAAVDAGKGATSLPSEWSWVMGPPARSTGS